MIRDANPFISVNGFLTLQPIFYLKTLSKLIYMDNDISAMYPKIINRNPWTNSRYLYSQDCTVIERK